MQVKSEELDVAALTNIMTGDDEFAKASFARSLVLGLLNGVCCASSWKVCCAIQMPMNEKNEPLCTAHFAFRYRALTT